MSELKVKSEEVVTVSYKLRNVNTKLSESFQKVSKKVETLSQCWKGTQALKDLEDYKVIEKQFLNNACMVVDDYIKALQKIANGFVLTEEENKRLADNRLNDLKKITYHPSVPKVDSSELLRNRFK